MRFGRSEDSDDAAGDAATAGHTAGDPAEEAFREFVEGSWHRLLRTAYLLTGDHASAEDLVQTALMQTYRHWRRIRRTDAPEVYVRRVLVNCNTSVWRRRRVHEYSTAAVPEIRRVHDHQDAYAVRDELWRSVKEMPPRMRTVFVLRYFEDMSEADVAEVMGCAIGSVKSQISRGLTRLRADLAESSDTVRSA
jgi:RNA polymerase sigma-70 factor (sigma-E family)